MTAEIEIWLDSMPHEIICVFSARCILRAMPGEMRRYEKKENDQKDYLLRVPEYQRDEHKRWLLENRPIVQWGEQMLPHFIYACVTLYAGVWPNRLTDMLFEDALKDIPRHGSKSFRLASAPLEYAAHERAGRAAAAAYASRDVLNWDCGIVGSLERCKRISDRPTSHELWNLTLSEDAIFIRAGGTALDLAKRPLWTDVSKFPDYWFGEYWFKMKDWLLAKDQNWDVWTSWYEAILYGTWYNSTSEQTELGLRGVYGRMTMPGRYYEDSSKVNSEIKKMLEQAV